MNTPYQKNSQTSKASAKKLDESGAANSQSGFILEQLGRTENGFTVDEMTLKMKSNGFPHIHNGTVAGRFVHLERLFAIKKTTETRKSSSGRDVTVFVIHDGTPYELPKVVKKEKGQPDNNSGMYIKALNDIREHCKTRHSSAAIYEIMKTIDKTLTIQT